MTIGVALIGAGAIGALRAEAVQQTRGLTLRVVVDLRNDLATLAAARSGADTTDDWQTAVQRPDVGLVIISTPPNTHAPIALAAMQAGKHVLCEKPLAHTLQDAERMCAAASTYGVQLNTGFNHRYFPSMRFARRLIDRGTIGDVVSVRAYAGHPGGQEFGHTWVHDGVTTGGGSLVDNGIHILDLTRFFMGNVATAKGYVANLVWPFDKAEDNSFALFRSANGAIGYVHASWTEWRGYFFSVEVVGTRGYVKASYPPMLAEWGSIPEPGIRARRRFALFPLFQVQERVRSWRWTIVRSFVLEHRDVIKGIKNNQPLSPTGQDGLRAMQMAHAIYRSSREGVDVAL